MIGAGICVGRIDVGVDTGITGMMGAGICVGRIDVDTGRIGASKFLSGVGRIKIGVGRIGAGGTLKI